MKEIINYPNYLIYEDGRVQNKTTKMFLKPQLSNRGYYNVMLSKNNQTKHCLIHRLIGLHYIPNIDNKPFIDHINRIKTDNRIENLRWATISENSINCSTDYKCKSTDLKGIRKTRNGTFHIRFTRNTLQYNKNVKTKEQAIIQRDLMLSMFIHDHE